MKQEEQKPLYQPPQISNYNTFQYCSYIYSVALFIIQYGLKFFHPPLAVVYREGWEWWASVELGRRFLLLLFTVSLPQNEVKVF